MTPSATSSPIIAAAIRASLGNSASDFTYFPSSNILTHKPTSSQYFAKRGSNVSQILGEAQGLHLISECAPGLCPAIHLAEQEEDGKHALFISDYVKLAGSSSKSLDRLAERMAKELHSPEKHSDVMKYGFEKETHCGVSLQDNTWETDWLTFYRDRRLGFLLSQISSKHKSSSSSLLALGKQIQDRVCPLLLEEGSFSPPAKPVLIHGDLWSGNVSTNGNPGKEDSNEPVIFDSAAYYGHNEVDFGISRMFGPFNDRFYEKYHSILPRSEPYYEERQQLYELYHHLNHYYMFGGMYASGATRIMESLLRWADEIEKK